MGPSSVVKGVAWLDPDGNEVSDEAWSRAISLLLNGQTLQVSNDNGEWITDDSFLLLVNAAREGVEFTLPESPRGNPWVQVMDTENIEDPFAQPTVGKSDPRRADH